MNGNGVAGRVAAGLSLLLLSAPAPAADRLLYFVEDGQVVITNTPSRADVRPLPGFEAPAGTPRRGAALPKTEYDSFIDAVARENGLSPELVKAVALAESGFDERAVSPKGAQGLMQLMPATSRRYGVSNPFDPHENLRAGARHLRDLLDEFEGDLSLALAAYNAGSGAVRRHGGVPAYRETRDYVSKVQGTLGRGARGTRRRAAPVDPVRLEQGPDGSVTLVNLD